jgi:hypothetical protein
MTAQACVFIATSLEVHLALDRPGARSWDFGFVQSKYRVASHG